MSKLCKKHGAHRARREVLRSLDLHVEAGEFLCVVGRSGSGKTTLLNILGGLDTDFTGVVVVSGREIQTLPDDRLSAFRSQVIGFVFQDFGLVDGFGCLENVLLPTVFVGAERRLKPRQFRVRAAELLERVGLGERRRARPSELSGGEKQRLCLARALVNCPQVLICDELTGNLDGHTGSEVLALLAELHREEGLTIVAATHDPRVVEAAQKVVHLEYGQLAGGGEAR